MGPSCEASFSIVLNIARLVDLQSDTVARWHLEPIGADANGFEKLVLANHEINFRLWHEEDDARDPAATDTVIANVKRRIDRLNQQRNDSIEALDVAIEEALRADDVHTSPDSSLNTETLGSALDRLSILALRIFHLNEQATRAELDEAARRRVAASHELAILQRVRLAKSAQELCDDLFAGRKRHQPFRQLKMYNDPTLNPAIYNRKR
jgi:hypothetical protein